MSARTLSPARFRTLCPAVALTHDGTFHADDLMAAGLLLALKPDLQIERTRDDARLASAKFLFDVGSAYEPRQLHFDHHFVGSPSRSFCETSGRTAGIPYSSIGLLWLHFGRVALEMYAGHLGARKRDHLHSWIDTWLIQPLDSIDNGRGRQGDEHVISYHLASLNNTWEEADGMDAAAYNESQDKRFRDASGWLAKAWTTFLSAVGLDMRKAFSGLQAEVRTHTAAAYERSRCSVNTARAHLKVTMASHKGPILQLDNGLLPWGCVLPRLDAHLPEKLQLQFVVYSAMGGGWRLHGVPAGVGSPDLRKPLPRAWRGLNREELASVTGVPDATFCHPEGFLASAETRRGILALAKLALAA